MATEKLYYATGKRKNAIARTWIKPGTGAITVNDRPADEYFTVGTARTILRQPLSLTNNMDAFDIKIKVHGGGDLRSGRCRASRYYQSTDSFRSRIASGIETRWIRQARPTGERERKKYGQKGARARFQFSKR